MNKLIKFKSYDTFSNWFSRINRSIRYPLIRRNSWRRSKGEYIDIFRYMENGKPVGVVFVVLYDGYYTDPMYIDLFEVDNKYHGSGIGTRMFDCIKEYYKKKYGTTHIVLSYVDRESEKFWRHMGFRRGEFCTENCELQYTIK